MKKLICILIMICVLAAAGFAEESGAVFSADGFSITLPDGLTILNESELAGYEAAAQADFPNAAETVLAAVNADASAVVTVLRAESSLDSVSAAKAASMRVLGSDTGVIEQVYGANRCGSFACAVGDLRFELNFLSHGAELYIIGTSGLDAAQTQTMLAGILF